MPFEMKYPYTDLEHLNLDWVYSEMKNLLDQYAVITDWIEHDAENFNSLLTRIIRLEGETLLLDNKISVERLQRQLAIDQVNQSISDQYDRITSEYTALYDSILTTFESMIVDIRTDLYSIRNDLVNQINAGDAAVLSYVEAELQTFLENLPDYEHLIIYNPVRGEQTTVQIAINDLYNEFNTYALTAAEYDALELTADEYDEIGLTAYEYDHYGQNHLLPDSPFIMRDPFTGKMTAVKNVVYTLADLHRLYALTATDYDALDLTADDYDALDLTAYDYDFHGVTP